MLSIKNQLKNLSFKSGIKEKSAEHIKNESSDVCDDRDEFMEDIIADRKKQRNFLIGSLIALGALTTPFFTDSEENIPSNNNKIEWRVDNEADKFIIDKADSLANECYDRTLDEDAFCQLLDFSQIENLPEHRKAAVKVQVSRSFQPVKMETEAAKKEILKQVKHAQKYMNDLAESYKENSEKSYTKQRQDFEKNHVSNEEILDNVDFRELSKYETDQPLVRFAAVAKREPIRRDDMYVGTKFMKQVDDAQRTVDKVVKDCKIRAKVSGNNNGDYTVSKYELADLLDTSGIDYLPFYIQNKILERVMEDYQPRPLKDIQDDNQIKRINKEVEKDRQRAQAKLDMWAQRAEKEFHDFIHPNEIKQAAKD